MSKQRHEATTVFFQTQTRTTNSHFPPPSDFFETRAACLTTVCPRPLLGVEKEEEEEEEEKEEEGEKSTSCLCKMFVVFKVVCEKVACDKRERTDLPFSATGEDKGSTSGHFSVQVQEQFGQLLRGLQTWPRNLAPYGGLSTTFFFLLKFFPPPCFPDQRSCETQESLSCVV